MSSVPQVFQYQGNDFRVKLVDGEPWFVVADACKALEIVNVTHVIERLDSDGVRQAEVIDSLGRKQIATIANEPNLYRLIFRSDKPEAKAFQDWVYNEVLPSIRKTGSYNAPGIQSSNSLEFHYQISGSTQTDIKRDQAILAHLHQAQTLLRNPRKVDSPRAIVRPYNGALMPVRSLEEKILACIERQCAKGTPPNLRDLTRYIKGCTSTELKTGVQELLDQHKIEILSAGKTSRYRLAA